MGFADEFFETVQKAREPVLSVCSRVQDFRKFTPGWLGFVYQVIRGTTPTLEYAVQQSDGFPWLRRFYVQRLRDERNHDDMMRKDIIDGAGISVTNLPLEPYAAEMVGRQFYLITARNPALYLGFIGLLEGFPPTEDVVDEIQRASGLPAGTFRTMRMHAHVDVQHKKDLAAVLDEVPTLLCPEILENAIRCAHLQALALASLVLRSNDNGRHD